MNWVVTTVNSVLEIKNQLTFTSSNITETVQIAFPTSTDIFQKRPRNCLLPDIDRDR